MIKPPKKMAYRKEIFKSWAMLSLFRSFEPATFTIDAEKNPIPTTAKKDTNAQANEAWLKELTKNFL